MPIIENRCPHGIAVLDVNGRQRVIATAGPPVSIETTPGKYQGLADGMPVYGPSGWTCFTNLPPRREGVTIVVSPIVGLAVQAFAPDRTDIVYPGTAPGDGASRSPGRGVTSVTRFIRAV
jgi:hypothetical protein